MVPRISYEWLRKKAPKLIVLTVTIVAILIIVLKILENAAISNTPIAGDIFVTSIVSITRNVTAVMATWGYFGVFLLMLLDASSFPIPSEMILPFAGYLVFTGDFDFLTVAAVATVAGVGGALIDYYIGWKGAHILKERRIIGRVLFSENQLATVVGWFNRYGAIMVFASRLIPIFRTLISFPAGAVRMPLKKFIAYTTLGSLAWNSMLIFVGYFLGTKWSQVVGVLNYLVVAVVVASVVVFITYLVWRRRRIVTAIKPTTPAEPALV